ncbi:MAG: class I SAM-dependent methyltransferase [Desulfatiglans sp.]|nr:class I SAM-dependent methyltransferase [Desulfatiglans sp.]
MDIREKTAKYFDLWSLPYDDISFYLDHIPSINSSVLELGCGTGRVLSQLVNHCDSYHGIDNSKAMIDPCIINVVA